MRVGGAENPENKALLNNSYKYKTDNMKTSSKQSLFLKESIFRFEGFEFLTYFEKGNDDKPLIVFFPGWSHLGRIAYQGANIPSREFLAEAFLEKGYSFLAISYPIEHPVYPHLYPQIKMGDWARAAAALAEEICKKQTLSRLIAVHWSAAGQLVTRFHKATQEKKLNHPFSVCLEATPPILVSSEQVEVAAFQSNGLISVNKLYPQWQRQISTALKYELNLKDYEEAFLGAFPVCLMGTSLMYSNGMMEENFAACIEDRCIFDYRDAPLVLSISGDAKSDSFHPLVDSASWCFMNERKIYHGYLFPIKAQIAQLSDEKWFKVLNLIKVFSHQMIHSIEGNHFLLIGQERVRQIVQIIEKGEESVTNFLDALTNFFHPHQFLRTYTGSTGK